MNIKLVRNINLSQKLAITPSLRKSIELLQLSRNELLQTIKDSINENPFLLNDSDYDDFYSKERDLDSIEEIISILPALRKKIKSVCSITNSKKSSIAKASDIHIEIKILKEACPHNLAPTTSTTSFLVVGDALAISLLEARKFSPEDFAKSHPAGSLGKKLTTLVSDLAITGKKVPIVKKNTLISEAIIEISSKKLGITLVQDGKKIIGIFTDGDLRRFLNENTKLDKVKINDVMTKQYVSVDSKALATEAAKLMEQNKIFTLIVKNNSGPSVITMHTLLEAGII